MAIKILKSGILEGKSLRSMIGIGILLIAESAKKECENLTLKIVAKAVEIGDKTLKKSFDLVH
jgi:hypothetical protein